jgi:hypothetical protein
MLPLIHAYVYSSELKILATVFLLSENSTHSCGTVRAFYPNETTFILLYSLVVDIVTTLTISQYPLVRHVS